MKRLIDRIRHMLRVKDCGHICLLKYLKFELETVNENT